MGRGPFAVHSALCYCIQSADYTVSLHPPCTLYCHCIHCVHYTVTASAALLLHPLFYCSHWTHCVHLAGLWHHCAHYTVTAFSQHCGNGSAVTVLCNFTNYVHCTISLNPLSLLSLCTLYSIITTIEHTALHPSIHCVHCTVSLNPLCHCFQCTHYSAPPHPLRALHCVTESTMHTALQHYVHCVHCTVTASAVCTAVSVHPLCTQQVTASAACTALCHCTHSVHHC